MIKFNDEEKKKQEYSKMLNYDYKDENERQWILWLVRFSIYEEKNVKNVIKELYKNGEN